jgi:hypothetical protein
MYDMRHGGCYNIGSQKLLGLQYVPTGMCSPWSSSSFDYSAICKDHSQVDDPILHRAISDCIGSAEIRGYPSACIPIDRVTGLLSTCNSLQPCHRCEPEMFMLAEYQQYKIPKPAIRAQVGAHIRKVQDRLEKTTLTA